ncbi:hypothetical protein CDAR_582431 [Caerostris darwini]|uniref:Uncharacterized protein n=1 Tax=Caerostris darwini TaxID=1538125 RepID=A0AAV4RF54_9ARAC|nr:hypothetical protein CDAR_582431 [Caerostris darwini]
MSIRRFRHFANVRVVRNVRVGRITHRAGSFQDNRGISGSSKRGGGIGNKSEGSSMNERRASTSNGGCLRRVIIDAFASEDSRVEIQNVAWIIP